MHERGNIATEKRNFFFDKLTKCKMIGSLLPSIKCGCWAKFQVTNSHEALFPGISVWHVSKEKVILSSSSRPGRTDQANKEGSDDDSNIGSSGPPNRFKATYLIWDKLTEWGYNLENHCWLNRKRHPKNKCEGLLKPFMISNIRGYNMVCSLCFYHPI